MRYKLNEYGQKMAGMLYEAFESPFPTEDKRWHKQQRLIEEAAHRISNQPLICNKGVERAKILGILEELYSNINHLRTAPKKV